MSNTENEIRHLSANEAAKRLKTSVSTVIRLFHEGTFKNAYKIGMKYCIPENELGNAKQQPFKDKEAS